MLLDKNQREIRTGDTLKIFHFIGARKKKYYNYKYVLSKNKVKNNEYFKVLHLGTDIADYYWLLNEDKILKDVEIVQGYNNKNKEISYEDRPKITLTKKEASK